MANRRGKLSILIEAKNLAGKAFAQVKSQARGMTQSVTEGTRSMGERIKGAIFSVKGLVTGFAALAALRVGRQLFRIGSAAEETASKYRTVFGPAVEQVNEFLDQNARNMGLVTSEAQELLASIGLLVQGIGATREESAQLAQQVAVMSADIASFSNVQGGAADVASRISRALLGEREALKGVQIAVLESDVQERALQQTRKTSISQVTALEKAHATLSIIADKAGVSLGDLERTMDSEANTARRVARDFRQIREEIAQNLLPLFGQLLGTVDENAGALFAVSDAVKAVIEGFTLLTAEIRIFGARAAQVWVGFPGLVRTATGDALVALSNFVRKADPLLSKLGIGLAGDVADSLLESGDELFASGEQAIISATVAFRETRDEILTELGRSFSGQTADTPLPELPDVGGGAADASSERLRKIREAGIETARALDMLSVKSDLLGESFDPLAERTKIVENAITAFTDAGLAADQIIPGLGLTLNELSQEYAFLTGMIEDAEERQQQFADDQKLIQSLLSDTETDAERYASVVERLNDAYARGTITQDQFSQGLDAARESFERGAMDLEGRAERLAENVSRGVQEALTGGLTDLGESLGQLLAQTGEQTASLGDIVTATMGGLLKTIGQSLIAFGTAGVAIKEFIKNPFLAIAAGVALVALGSALSSSVQSSVASTGSALASGTPTTGGASPTAGAGFDREFAGIGGGNLTLVIEGGDLLDMSNPKTERQLSDAFEDLTGRRVTVIRRT